MDETLSEASSSIKEEKSIENSDVPEEAHWKKYVKNWVPPAPKSEAFVFHNCIKTWVKTNENDISLAEEPRCAEEKCADVRCPCMRCVPSEDFVDDKPFGRKGWVTFKSQREIAFVRECKKLELLWKNRGLPVDKESLRLAASKDPFDLKDLSESLPSTSAEKFQKDLPLSNMVAIRRMRRELQERPQAYMQKMRQLVEKMEAIHKSPAFLYTPRERRIFCGYHERLPASETIPDGGNALKEIVMKDALQRAQTWSRWKRMHIAVPHLDPEKELDSDEKKEANEARGNSDLEKVLQNWLRKGPETIRDPNVCPEFAGMSLDDKQEEKMKESQSSDATNSQGSVGLAPSPEQIWDKCSGWDSKRPWVADFAVRDLRVPLNSPIKKERIEYKDLPSKLKEKFADIRQQMSVLREQSKLRTLNRHRGVSGDIEYSESHTNLQQASRSSMPRHLNSVKVARDLCLTNLKVCHQMMMQLRESAKTFRSFKGHLSFGSVKSDKVMPD